MAKLNVVILLVGAAWMVAGHHHNNVHPCGSSISYDCVQAHFGDMGTCTVVDTPVENPEYDVALPVYVPITHVTAILKDISLDSSLRGDIEEFYYHTDSGQYVISVHFPHLGGEAHSATFVIERDGKEPKVTTDYANATYPITITANIPADMNGLTVEALRNAQYTATIHSGGGIGVGPKLATTSDPEILTALMGLFKDLPTTFEEIHRTKATFYFLAWLQNYICDFELHTVLKDYELSVVSNLNEVDTDDESHWSYICASAEDLETCARDYFTKQGSCSAVSSDQGPVTRGAFKSHIPSESVTLIQPETIVTGLDGNIKSFYINELTNNLVISVEFDKIGAEIPEAAAVLHRTGRVDKTVTDYAKVTYGVSLTATIPLPLSAESIRKAYVSGSTTDAQIKMGPQLTGSTDPEIVSMVQSVAANQEVVSAELMVTSAYNYFLLYLQNHLCNFDIPNNYTPSA